MMNITVPAFLRKPGTRKMACGLCVAVLLLVGSLFIMGQALNRVVLVVDGTSREYLLVGGNVESLLNRAGITISDSDSISHSLTERLKDGDVVEVKKAFPVAILADGKEYIVKAAGVTVAELLDKAGLGLGPLDRVEPGLDHALQKGDVVRVVRVEKNVVKVQSEVPFREIRRSNPRLDRGETRVVQNGINGLREDTVEITLEDGVEVSSVVLSSEIVRVRQDRIVETGENTLLSRGGRTLQFDRVITVTATAYCPGTPESGCPIDRNGHSKCTGKYNDGFTYTGRKAAAGDGTEASPHIIAVDPRVIPLGSRVYIDGYGFAVAADIGSAIKGNRIDLLFDKHDDAWLFGRKRLKVYLLP